MSERQKAIFDAITVEWQDVASIARTAGVDMRYGMKDVMYRTLRTAVSTGLAETRRVWDHGRNRAMSQWRLRP